MTDQKNSKLELVIGFNHLSLGLPLNQGLTVTEFPLVLRQVNRSNVKLPSCFDLPLDNELTMEKSLVIQPRALAETDINVRHIIPYILLIGKNDQKIHVYQRKGSEGRLNGKWALGVGGHLNTNHLECSPFKRSETKVVDMRGSIFNCIKAECVEELGIRTASGSLAKFDTNVLKDLKLIGEIMLDTSEVSSVHYGLACALIVPSISQYTVIDGAVNELSLKYVLDHKNKVVQIETKDLEFEEWSDMIINDVRFQKQLYDWVAK